MCVCVCRWEWVQQTRSHTHQRTSAHNYTIHPIILYRVHTRAQCTHTYICTNLPVHTRYPCATTGWRPMFDLFVYCYKTSFNNCVHIERNRAPSIHVSIFHVYMSGV
jgi:hypothetical protein